MRGRVPDTNIAFHSREFHDLKIHYVYSTKQPFKRWSRAGPANIWGMNLAMTMHVVKHVLLV